MDKSIYNGYLKIVNSKIMMDVRGLFEIIIIKDM